MDAARGIAVAGMVFVHLVPLDGLGDRLGPAVAATAGGALEGTSAGLFFILIGMAWGIQADRHGPSRGFWRFVLRRSLALLGLGVLMHVLVWPTEVLVPFAIMMAPSLLIRRAGKGAVAFSILAILVVVVLSAGAFSSLAAGDWKADGSHLADATLGWATVRYLLINGNYPLIPWLAFPLLGMALGRVGEGGRERTRRWLIVALAVGVFASVLTIWTESHMGSLGESAKYVSTAWVPTTVPFMLLNGSLAVAVVCGIALSCWDGWRAIGFNLIAWVGRASLTNYVAHICVVCVPLRMLYPGEDWPFGVGLAATCAYLGAAAPLSMLWFRSHRRGPLEQTMAWLSGSPGAK